MAAQKNKTVVVGNNVRYRQEGSVAWFGIDLDEQGEQTKGSKEPGKIPREMVGSTGSFTDIPGTGGKLMLHYTRPMEVQQVRKARALRELEEEDTDLGADRLDAEANPLANISPAKLKKILALLS